MFQFFVFGFLTCFPFFLPLLIWFLTAHYLLSLSPSSFPRFCLFASVLLRWLRCCSSVWQPSYFWGIPWVWRGASIRFSPSLYKPSGLDGRQSVRRGYCGCQRRRIRVSAPGGTEGPHKLRPTRNTATPGLKREFLHFPALGCEPSARMSKSASRLLQDPSFPWTKAHFFRAGLRRVHEGTAAVPLPLVCRMWLAEPCLPAGCK